MKTPVKTPAKSAISAKPVKPVKPVKAVAPATPTTLITKANTLAGLKQIKATLQAQARVQAALLAEQAQQAKQQAAHKKLFQTAIGAVQPLLQKNQANLRPTPPQPIPKQRQRDEAAALQEAISDAVDITTLLDTDDLLSFRRPGVGTDVTHKLRRGKWSIQQQLDLHGLRSDEARDALGQFIRQAHKKGLRCVRIIHGKGLGSPGKTPVLKDKVLRWLVQKTEVIAFVQATPAHGGAGALLVLLQPVLQPVLQASTQHPSVT